MPRNKLDLLNLRPYARIFRKRKLNAFLVSALTAFIALCGLAALTVNGFTSTSQLTISTPDNEHAPSLISDLLREQMTDEGLKSVIQEVADSNGIESSRFVNQRLDEIRDSLNFKIEQQVDGTDVRITASYNGSGLSDEAELVQSIVSNIGQNLTRRQDLAMTQQQINDRFAMLQNGIDRFATSQTSRLTKAANSVGEIDNGLSHVHNQLRQPGVFENSVNSSSLAAQRNDDKDGNRFQTAGFRKIRPGVVNELKSSIEGIDTHSIQDNIVDMKLAIETNAIQRREDVATLKALTTRETLSGFELKQQTGSHHTPVGGTPGTGLLLFFVLGSIVFGMIVCEMYKPELSDTTYESSDEISSHLGVPVIATLSDSDSSHKNSKRASEKTIANEIVRYSEIALFGCILLIFAVCLFEPTVRAAFFENPLHGLARMTWMFIGS